MWSNNKPQETALTDISPFGKNYRAVLIFPSPYHIASSNLAFHQIYRIIGQHSQWSCERAVVEPGKPVRTIESNRSLDEFDLVTFTVPFEFDYLNVLRALQFNKIPLYSNVRRVSDPFILLGGIAVAANPTVLAPFADLILLGEGEVALPPFLDLYAEQLTITKSKQILLEKCQNLPGAYLPSLQGEQPPSIHFARVKDMDAYPPCSAWLTPDTEFSNTFLFEISRGCPCGCRFCMIRLSQKPLRAVSVARIEELVSQVESCLQSTVLSSSSAANQHPSLEPTVRIGLVGAAVASHPDFEEICRRLRNKGWGLTAAAIEIDKVTDGILDLLCLSQKTLTLAPERGLEAERFRLGKRISDHHLLQVARRAGELGIPRLKLYFIVGIVTPEFYGAKNDRVLGELNLPDWLAEIKNRDQWYERIFQHEAETISQLVNRLAEVYRPAGRQGAISITCSPFIPKPHTPWEGWQMVTEKGLKVLDKILRKRMSELPRVHYHSFSGWECLFQGLLSQGDQRLAPYLVQILATPDKQREIIRTVIETGMVPLHERRWLTQAPPWSFVHL